MPSALIVHENPSVGQQIASALQAGGYQVLAILNNGKQAQSHLGKIEIALISIHVPDVDGFSLIHAFKKTGATLVPILQGNEGGDVWQKILSNDLRDVLMSNQVQDPNAVLGVLHSAESHTASAGNSASQGGYLTAVASARGGVGKSIFAVNLAIAMAQYDASVVLIDYSMFAGDFYSMLDHVPRNTVIDAIGQGEMDEGFLSSLLSKHPIGFSYLACPNDEFDFYGFDYDSARALLKICRRMFDYVVIDTGVYDLPPTNAAVDESDLVYLMTNRDLARFMSLQRLIKNYRQRGFPDEKIKVIVNNAEVGTEITENEIEEVIEHPVTAYLPSIGIESTMSINSGKPLMVSKQDQPMVNVIKKLAEFTVQRWEV
ncbi:MAG: P-loop NTPase [Candidatus Methylacidiphilales bacterium]